MAESIVRDILVLYHGGEDVINEELSDLPVKHVRLDALDDIAYCIRGIRQGMNENINLKNAMSELLMLLRDVAAVRA